MRRFVHVLGYVPFIGTDGTVGTAASDDGTLGKRYSSKLGKVAVAAVLIRSSLYSSTVVLTVLYLVVKNG